MSKHFVFFTTPRKVIDDLFEPSAEDEVIPFEDGFTLADCVTSLGVFPSRTQARKNGWDGEIPRGYNEYTVGKNKQKFWTFRPSLWEAWMSQGGYSCLK